MMQDFALDFGDVFGAAAARICRKLGSDNPPTPTPSLDIGDG